ncbi:MAG: hypothetical protein LQ342_007481 [Letrouitia transgressa]|nr:MAG: hypothetical protein LQ342_007481 [Letrouitia transgressa]
MASGVDAKIIKQTKFPPEFNLKVDMQKVNIEVIKKWAAERISEILGTEDDVVTNLCFGLLESSRFPDIKAIQVQLTGFLGKEASKFCKELWMLCLSAQDNPSRVPTVLLEAKKLELKQEKPMKKPGDAKSKRGNEIGDQIAFGSEIVVIAVEYFQNPTPIELIEVI